LNLDLCLREWAPIEVSVAEGGGAWLRSDFSLQVAGSADATISDTREGWAIGVGGECAFSD